MTRAYRRCTTLWLAFAVQLPLAVCAQENSTAADKAEEATPPILPAAPAKENLLPFYVSPQATMNFAIDAPSVSVTPDGVVRFTLVITSSEGARNVSHEGIRCKTGERKLYATGGTDGNWSASRNDAWSQIRDVGANRQYAALYKDYFCDFGSVSGNAAAIVKRIRQKKTLR
jgi:CNP1-like family